MSQLLETYFKHPHGFLDVTQAEPGAGPVPGYFRFGGDIICYGRVSEGQVSKDPLSIAYDAAESVVLSDSRVELPFDLDEVVGNLQYERYTRPIPNDRRDLARRAIRQLYYTFRPVLPFPIKKRLQKWHLSGWKRLSFPQWPVDSTVDTVMRRVLEFSLTSGKIREIPFIWFWPNGCSACAIMTHDVESETGVRLSQEIMDLDQSYGVPASFQIVPEKRYPVTPEYLQEICARGFELNVQDLNHDGRLFDDFEEFKARAIRINAYKVRFGSSGFRSAVLYRKQDWYEWLNFEYDMSVPNVAHLDPQRGGCCTVLPYFIGGLVELPVTTTQDYMLFHILERYDLNLWKRQVSSIMENNGLISFIVHPDYIRSTREQRVYQELLEMIVDLKRQGNIWLALPREVSAWWKQRNQMKLKQIGGRWQVEGAGSERAIVAFARVESGRLIFELDLRRLGRASGTTEVRATSLSN